MTARARGPTDVLVVIGRQHDRLAGRGRTSWPASFARAGARVESVGTGPVAAGAHVRAHRLRRRRARRAAAARAAIADHNPGSDRLLLDHRGAAVAAAGGDLARLDRRREPPRAPRDLAAAGRAPAAAAGAAGAGDERALARAAARPARRRRRGPVPVERLRAASGRRDIAAITYAGDPEKRRLDFMLEAWSRARRERRDAGRRRDRPARPRRRASSSAGRLAPAEYRALLRRAQGVRGRAAPRGLRDRAARGAGRRLPARDHARAGAVPGARELAASSTRGWSSDDLATARSASRSTIRSPDYAERARAAARAVHAAPRSTGRSRERVLPRLVPGSGADDGSPSSPARPSNGFHIGPFFLHAYGIAYVFAVAAAILVTRRRWERPAGTRDLVYEVALWGFPAGLIGGRIYFLITTPSQIPPHWWGPFAIWKGGLGIWGGIAAGVAAGLWVLRRRLPTRRHPAVHGRAPRRRCSSRRRSAGSATTSTRSCSASPTTLPWALEDRPGSPARPATSSTRPSSRRSCTRSSGTCRWPAFLVWLGHHRKISAPGLFALYVAGYSGFRIFEETLRIDYSNHILGLRLNFFVAAVLCIAGLVWFVAIQRGWPARRASPAAELAGGAVQRRALRVRLGSRSRQTFVRSSVASDRQRPPVRARSRADARQVHDLRRDSVPRARRSRRSSAAPRARLRRAQLALHAHSAHGRVLATSAAVSHARRAVAIP